MKQSKWAANSAAFGLIVVFLGLAGCGGKGSAVREEVAPADGSKKAREGVAAVVAPGASSLVLRIVPAGDDPAFPAFSESTPGRWDQVVAQGEEISFKNVIPIPPSPTPAQLKEGKGYHPLFLAWSEESLGVPIREAHWEHRLQDEKNFETGEVDRFNVSFDEKKRVWFIPLSRFFKRSEQDADPSEVHLIVLDLFKANQERVQIQVRLRMTAQVPHIQARALPPEAVPEKFVFAQTVAKQGWPLLTEEYLNPTGRKLALWVKVNNETGKEPQVQVKNFVFNASCTSPYQNAVLQNGVYQYSLKLGRIQIRRSAGPVENVAGEPGKWTRLELKPHENLSIAWMGEAPVGLPVCSRVDLRFQAGFCNDGLYFSTWFRKSTQIQGNWSRKVVATDSLVHAPEQVSAASSRLEVVADGGVTAAFENGPALSGAVEIQSCSGTIEPIKTPGGLEL